MMVEYTAAACDGSTRVLHYEPGAGGELFRILD